MLSLPHALLDQGHGWEVPLTSQAMDALCGSWRVSEFPHGFLHYILKRGDHAGQRGSVERWPSSHRHSSLSCTTIRTHAPGRAGGNAFPGRVRQRTGRRGQVNVPEGRRSPAHGPTEACAAQSQGRPMPFPPAAWGAAQGDRRPGHRPGHGPGSRRA